MVSLEDAEVRVSAWIRDIAATTWEDDEDFASGPDFPLEFLTDENLVECRATLYERFNGAVVLRLDAEIMVTTDRPEVRQWALDAPGQLPYVQLRYDRLYGGNLVRLVATHSLSVDHLDRFVLEQVLSSFDFIVPQWAERVGRLDTGRSVEGTDSTRPAPSLPSDDAPSFGGGGSGPAGTVVHETQSREDGVRAVLEELESLIGLQPVKDLVRQLANVQQVADAREKLGKKALRPSPHLVFTGNPGTGKTTVARLVGRLYAEMGLLERGHVVETGRHGLIGGYIGQTAIKTKEVLDSARGGVLFIDEAYSLFVNHHLDYGREAIETILAYMENHRGEIAVVVAGYPDKMREFLAMNPGLDSRFDYTLDFPDFSDDDLVRIFAGFAAAYDYEVSAPAEASLRSLIARMDRGKNFGNAREVRKIFNEVVVRHSGLLVERGIQLGDTLCTIGADAFAGIAAGPAGSRPAVGYL